MSIRQVPQAQANKVKINIVTLSAVSWLIFVFPYCLGMSRILQGFAEM